MVTEDELEGFRKDRYLARSWALLTRDRGWVKPVLLLAVALLVPVVGWFGVAGYALEWARLTAWGVNAAPKQRRVRVGECIASGARAFVVTIVWALVVGIALAVLSALPLLDEVVDTLSPLLNIALAVVCAVAQLRATIYRRIVPGLRAGTIWKMVRRDPWGLLRVVGIELAGNAIIAAFSFVMVSFAFMAALPHLVGLVQHVSWYNQSLPEIAWVSQVLAVVIELLAAMGPALVVILLVDCFLVVLTSLLVYTAVGLWMRQFDVAAWGADEDPLPGEPAGLPGPVEGRDGGNAGEKNVENPW